MFVKVQEILYLMVLLTHSGQIKIRLLLNRPSCKGCNRLWLSNYGRLAKEQFMSRAFLPSTTKSAAGHKGCWEGSLWLKVNTCQQWSFHLSSLFSCFLTLRELKGIQAKSHWNMLPWMSNEAWHTIIVCQYWGFFIKDHECYFSKLTLAKTNYRYACC